jgi:hypothetical protein
MATQQMVEEGLTSSAVHLVHDGTEVGTILHLAFADVEDREAPFAKPAGTTHSVLLVTNNLTKLLTASLHNYTLPCRQCALLGQRHFHADIGR